MKLERQAGEQRNHVITEKAVLPRRESPTDD